jgi:hypothetical protein
VASRSIFSRSANGRSQRSRLRQQLSRRLAVESIEGRLLLSATPVSSPVLDPVIAVTISAHEASAGQTSAPPGNSTPSATSDGYIVVTGPITYSNDNQAVTNGMGPRASISTASTVSSLGLIQHFDQSTGATANDINPRVVGIELAYSGEGGPIGLSPMGARSSETSDSARPLISMVERGTNNAPHELSLASLTSSSTLAAEWARPTISEVAGDEPGAMSPEDQIDQAKQISPLPGLPQINTDPSAKVHAADVDAAQQHSARSSDHADTHSRTADQSQILPTGVHESARWIDAVFEHGQNWTATMRKPDAVSNGIALPASYLRFSPLDRKLLNQPESASPSPDGPRVLKSAARSNASISGVFKSVSNLEPLLAVLLLDYVAARKFQQLTKKESLETIRSPKTAS